MADRLYPFYSDKLAEYSSVLGEKSVKVRFGWLQIHEKRDIIAVMNCVQDVFV